MQDEHHRWQLTWLGSDRLLARGFARPVARFLSIEAAAGVVLLVAAALALVIANSPLKDAYHAFWLTQLEISIGDFQIHLSLLEFVNDALMALFFFVVGMEIKREMVSGELRDPKTAALPILAAVGGMLVPALIYLGFNAGTPGAHGFGIPVATDIAFAVGVVSLLGRRVPVSLKLFLLTLAVADDLGGIAVIAVAYSSGLEWAWLAGAGACFCVIGLLRRARVWHIGVYIVVGVIAWYCMFRSGVHATVAGVVLGFLVPTRPLRPEPDSQVIADQLENQSELTAADVRNAAFHIRESVPMDLRLIDALHWWTGFVVIPIFAFANAGVTFGPAVLSGFPTSVTLGIAVGLVVGKVIGVCGAAYLAVALRVARLPRGVRFSQMVGISLAAGVGFTVALFLTGVSFPGDPALQDQAKLGIFIASGVAAVLATVVLSAAARRIPPEELALEKIEQEEVFAAEPGAIVIPD